MNLLPQPIGCAPSSIRRASTGAARRGKVSQLDQFWDFRIRLNVMLPNSNFAMN